MTRCPRCKSQNSLIQEDGDDYCVLCGYRKEAPHDPLRGTGYASPGMTSNAPGLVSHTPIYSRVNLTEKQYQG